MSFDVSDGFVWRRGNESALIVEASIDISRLARAYGYRSGCVLHAARTLARIG